MAGELGNLSATARLEGASEMRAALASISGAAGSVKSGLGSMLGPLAAVTGAIAGVATVGAALKSALNQAADMEGFEVGFSILLGSVAKAKERMADLAKFADETPFELPEVTAASRTLETLTQGALSTGKGLTVVGDVASGTGQPFSELSVQIGRLYAGLQNGRPVGEAMQRLEELGAILPDTRNKIEAMQQSGQKGPAVWAKATADFARFGGMMKAQSETMHGQMSNLSGSIGAVFREFGRPINDALKPLVSGMTGALGQLAPMAGKASASIAGTFTTLVNAFKSGKLGELVGLSLQIGSMTFINSLSGGIIGLGRGLGAAASLFGEIMVAEFSHYPTYIKALADGLVGAVQTMGAMLLEVMQKPVVSFQAGLQFAIEKAQELFGGAKASSYADIYAERAKQGASFYGLGVGDLAAKGQTNTENSRAGFGAVFDGIDVKGGLQSILQEIEAGVKEGVTFDGATIDGVRTKLSDLAKSRQTAGEAISNTANKVGPAATAGVGGGSAPKFEGDRLARIGGFIGGPGGPALDYARRAAAGIEKLVQMTARPPAPRFESPYGILA